MSITETLDQETERMLTYLVAKIEEQIEERQAAGERISRDIRALVMAAYHTGAMSRQPEIDRLEESLDILVRSDR